MQSSCSKPNDCLAPSGWLYSGRTTPYGQVRSPRFGRRGVPCCQRQGLSDQERTHFPTRAGTGRTGHLIGPQLRAASRFRDEGAEGQADAQKQNDSQSRGHRDSLRRISVDVVSNEGSSPVPGSEPSVDEFLGGGLQPLGGSCRARQRGGCRLRRDGLRGLTGNRGRRDGSSVTPLSEAPIRAGRPQPVGARADQSVGTARRGSRRKCRCKKGRT